MATLMLVAIPAAHDVLKQVSGRLLTSSVKVHSLVKTAGLDTVVTVIWNIQKKRNGATLSHIVEATVGTC